MQDILIHIPSFMLNVIEIVDDNLTFILHWGSSSSLYDTLISIEHMRILAESLLVHLWREFILGSLITSVVMLVWIRAS